MYLSQTTQPQLQATDAHTLSFAQAILHTVTVKPDLAPTIQAAIEAATWSPAHTAPHTPETTTFTLSPDTTIRTIQWITTVATPETHPATVALLQTWADAYEAPKDAVIGIVGIAIMGPTLGILDKPKKKKKAELPVIIENSAFAALTKTELVRITTELSQQVYGAELRLAHGNAYHLHPDTAEWLFEAGPVSLYTTTASDLAAIQAAVKQHHVLHQQHDAHDAIALSPAQAETILEHHTAHRVV